MRNERRLSYLKSQIEKLNAQVKTLEQENKSLEQLNEHLLKANELKQNNIDRLEEEHRKAMTEYMAGLVEIKQLREKYQESIQTAYKAKAEYTSKSDALLKRLRKEK